jgi:hypothetical protein
MGVCEMRVVMLAGLLAAIPMIAIAAPYDSSLADRRAVREITSSANIAAAAKKAKEKADEEEREFSEALASSANIKTDSQIWTERFDKTTDHAAKLALLQQAWDKSMDERFPWYTQQAWHDAWQSEYEKEFRAQAIRESMPNPYAISAPQSAPIAVHMTCVRSENITNCD